MATLNIKNLSDKLYQKLQKRAALHHRSVAQEVTHILAEALDQPAPLSILDLKGVGKESWKGIDPSRHMKNERRAWD
jgi:hypothetical protein